MASQKLFKKNKRKHSETSQQMEEHSPPTTKKSTPNSSSNRSLFCASPSPVNLSSNSRIDETESNSSSSARSLFFQDENIEALNEERQEMSSSCEFLFIIPTTQHKFLLCALSFTVNP